MTLTELQEEIIEELEIDMKEEDIDSDLLEVKVKSAIRDVKTARKYPSTYSDAMIEADMEKFFSQIKAIAMFDYNQIGAEGQKGYSADGENIQYLDRKSLFDGVYPLSTVS